MLCTADLVCDRIANPFQALTRLINEVSAPEPHSDALTAAMLLSSYEVLQADEVSHRSHYEGALQLIRAKGISAASEGLEKANFVVYVRHEMYIALTNESPLQLRPEDWSMTHPATGAAEDDMAIYLLWLAATAINLVYDTAPAVERQDLLERVEIWYESTSPTFRGIEYSETSEDGLKKVFFPVPESGKCAGTRAHPFVNSKVVVARKLISTLAAAMLWYHLIYILLFAEIQNPIPASYTIVLKLLSILSEAGPYSHNLAR